MNEMMVLSYIEKADVNILWKDFHNIFIVPNIKIYEAMQSHYSNLGIE